jgi:uroporphyrinogen III methyltransferase/synthase
VFTSGNGVDGLLNRILSQEGDLRILGPIRIAALGKGTAERLSHYHLRSDLTPKRVDPTALAQELVDDAPGGGFLLARAQGDRPLLADELEELGAAVDQIATYRTVDVLDPNQDVADALEAGEVAWITVTSSPTARSLVQLYGEALRSAKIISISPLTSATLREMGFEPAMEATPHTVDGMIAGLMAAGGRS